MATQIGFANFTGLAGDSKPMPVGTGSTFYETDTTANFIYDGNGWKKFQGVPSQDQPSPPSNPSDPPTQAELQAILNYTKDINDALVKAGVLILPPPTIVGRLLSGNTFFGFQTTEGEKFTVEQDGTIQSLTGTHSTNTISGVNDSSDITIKLTGANTFFRFVTNNVWKSFNLVEIGNITDLSKSFMEFSNLETFKCDADLGGVVNFDHTWHQGTFQVPAINIGGGTNFPHTFSMMTTASLPSLDWSSATNLASTFDNMSNLQCHDGTIDFTSLTDGRSAWDFCSSLVQPPASSTVRISVGMAGSNAIKGKWANPGNCP